MKDSSIHLLPKALCQLRLINICTNELKDVTDFFVKVMKMKLSNKAVLNDRQRDLWGVSELSQQKYYYLFSSDLEIPQIRIIVNQEDTQSIRKTSLPTELGIYNLHFDVSEKIYSKISKKNSTGKAQPLVFTGPGEVQYTCHQSLSQGILFKAAASIVEHLDEEIEFYTRVLGMQSDVLDLSSNEPLSIPGVTTDHHSRKYVFDPEQTSLQLHFITVDEELIQDSAVPPRMPHHGWCIWTFETSDIGEVLARAHARRIAVFKSPRKIYDPELGELICMSLISPSGYLIEVISKV